MKKTKGISRYTNWMGEFERKVNELWPEHAGKIDWSDPEYVFWCTPTSATHAAIDYVVNHREER